MLLQAENAAATLLGEATGAVRLCVSFVAKKQQNVKPTDHDRAQHEKSASEIQEQENQTQGSIARYAKSATLQSTWRCSAEDRAPSSTQKFCKKTKIFQTETEMSTTAFRMSGQRGLASHQGALS